jgi:hypothetical protein
MRYRDLISPPSLAACETPDHIVLLHVHRGDMKRLEAMILSMDVSLSGPIRRMPNGTVFVEIACCDAATASALRTKW